MAKFKRKVDQKLADRMAGHRQMAANSKNDGRGLTAPGSRNPRKR